MHSISSISFPWIPQLLRLTDHITMRVGEQVRDFLLSTNDVLLLQFIFAFAHIRVPRWVRVYQISLLLTTPFVYTALEYDWMRIQWANIIYPVWQLPFIAVLFVLLFLRLRGNREAGLLFWPLIIARAVSIVGTIGLLLFRLRLRETVSVIPDLPIGPFSIDAITISNFLFLLAIGVVLFKRFNEVAAERERTAAELEAGRNVQSLLVPKVTPNTPGFHIESAYVPAQEVGGDFFQVLPAEDGSTLIVIGDVSGKGLKAAMVVATIVGALRYERSRNPADVLAHLNELLKKQLEGGFVTCCAALLSGDTVSIANAGHIPPYLNGEPIELEANLPLGVIANLTYAESEITIAPGDTLTFLSDGVVEARAEKGELLGFDRTRDLVRSSAQEIAETARSFGQEDDITVVTIRRELVGAYVA